MALIADDRRQASDLAVARAALAGLDRLLGAVPPGSSLPAGEIAALVRLIRNALPPVDQRASGTDE